MCIRDRPYVDPNAVQPCPVLEPVREAHPRGPLRRPVPCEPTVEEHGRAPHAGGTEAAQGLVAVPAEPAGSDVLALAGRGRRLPRDA
eukprot:10228463-Alexandrium_andersonii.AAC.1